MIQSRDLYTFEVLCRVQSDENEFELHEDDVQFERYLDSAEVNS